MEQLIQRLRLLRREVLGLNRRNQEYMIRLNAAPLVALVDNKVRTKELLERHGLPVPATYARYATNGSLSSLATDLAAYTSCVIKPSHGAGGEGVLVLGRAAGVWQRPSGIVVRDRDIAIHAADILAGAFALARHRDEVLVEERLDCDASLAAFSPGGVPDIRVIVVHGIPLMAMLRLPTRASDGRANLHVGGIGVGLSLATGKPTHAIWNHTAIERHPDTAAPLRTIELSGWNRILEISAASYDAIRLGYFGIDVVVDAQRGPVILELNARPGLGIQLANHRGLRPLLEGADRLGDRQGNVDERIADGLALAG